VNFLSLPVYHRITAGVSPGTGKSFRFRRSGTLCTRAPCANLISPRGLRLARRSPPSSSDHVPAGRPGTSNSCSEPSATIGRQSLTSLILRVYPLYLAQGVFGYPCLTRQPRPFYWTTTVVRLRSNISTVYRSTARSTQP